MINFFRTLKKFLNFKKNEKNYKRIIFNENLNTFKYLEDLVKSNKNNFCILSLEDLSKFKIKNHNYYYFNNSFFISLIFIFLKIKYLYTSTPDLNNSIFRKSIHKKTKYIYIQHSPVSLSMAYKYNAFLEFDYVQVVNKNQYSDIIDMNNIYKKKIKPLKSKYLFLNNLRHKNKNVVKNKIDYLIAPSWNTDFYKLDLHRNIFKILKDLNKSFIFRPHYMSIVKKEFLIDKLNLDKKFIDLNSNLNFDNYENLISDWSGIYLEFAIIKNKKPLLINSKMKIRNENYKKFSSEPIELEIRDKLSVQFNTNELNQFRDFVSSNTEKNFDNLDIYNIYSSKFY